MGKKETIVSKLCKELETTKSTLYGYVGSNNELKYSAKRILEPQNN